MDLSRGGQFHFPNHDFEAREVGELDLSNPHLAAEGRGGGGLDPLPDRLEVDPAGGESDGDDSEDANDADDPCDRLDDLPEARHRHRRGEASEIDARRRDDFVRARASTSSVIG